MKQFLQSKGLKNVFFILTAFIFIYFGQTASSSGATVDTVETFASLDASDGSTDGIYTVIGDLTIANTGSIDCSDPAIPANNSGCPIRIHVSGDMVILPGGSIFATNDTSGGSGALIEIVVGGDFIVFGGGITSSSRTTTGGSGNGGNIDITVEGSIDFMPGSMIAAANEGGGVAGTIRITAGGTIDIDGTVSAGSDTTLHEDYLTGFVLERGNTTQKGGKIFITSNAQCIARPAVIISTEGVVVSQGEDPASDSIVIVGCGIEVNGLVASVSKKTNGTTTNRPFVEMRSGSSIVVNGQDLGGEGPNQGRIRADYVVGEAPLEQFITLCAKENIIINGPGQVGGTIFSVSSNGGTSTNQPGGTITFTSVDGGINLAGLAVQADGGAGSGGMGGNITLESKLDINLNSATVSAAGSITGGNPDGGHVSIRSYSGDILSNSASFIDVTGGAPTPEGSVDLTACGTIGFPAGTIIPVSAVKNTPLCSPEAPVGCVLPLCSAGEESEEELVICAGDSLLLPWNGYVHDEGDYSHTYQTQSGCDSLVTIHLTVNPGYEVNLDSSICDNDSLLLPWNGYVHEAGDYTHTYQTLAGCDSLVTIHLSISPSDTTHRNEAICQSDSLLLPWNGYVKLAGDYSHTYEVASGCDSVVIIHLTLNPLDTTHQNESICETDSLLLPWNGYVKIAGDYTHTYEGTSGCDSLVIIHLSLSTVDSVHRHEAICENDSLLLPWNGYVKLAGDYTHTYPVDEGCDSVVTIHLTVYPVYDEDENALICQGDSILLPWNGYVKIAGNYSHTYSSIHGCDSLVTIHLTLKPSYHLDSNAVICYGSSFTLPWGGTVTAAGNYSHDYGTQAGCDSILTVHLTVNPRPYCTITGNSEFCAGDSVQLCATAGLPSYSWNTGATTRCIWVKVAGTYSDTVINAYGCKNYCSKTVTIKAPALCCNGFRTQTMGGWGAKPQGGNAGTYLKNKFATTFVSPNYLTVGCTNTLKFTTWQAVNAFLVCSGTPAALPAGNIVNPTVKSINNTFAGQTIALTLSVNFDLTDPNFSSSSTHLKDLIVASGTFAGWTVSQVLAEANRKLGGCSSIYSFSQLTQVLDLINSNYVDGTTNKGNLLCPTTSPTRLAIDNTEMDENVQVKAYPNPFTSSTTIEFSQTGSASHAIVEVFALSGAKVATLFDGRIESGELYTAVLKADQLTRGIYVYRVTIGKEVISGKLVLIE